MCKLNLGLFSPAEAPVSIITVNAEYALCILYAIETVEESWAGDTGVVQCG